MRFADALDRRGEEIERPPLIPVGTYIWTVTKPPELDTIADGRFDVVDFTLRCVQQCDDVDPDSISEFEAKAGQVAGKVRRLRFLFNTEDEGAFNNTEFRMKSFIENHLGVSMEGKTWKETFADVVGNQCQAEIRWRPDPKDPEIMYDELGRTSPVA